MGENMERVREKNDVIIFYLLFKTESFISQTERLPIYFFHGNYSHYLPITMKWLS